MTEAVKEDKTNIIHFNNKIYLVSTPDHADKSLKELTLLLKDYMTYLPYEDKGDGNKQTYKSDNDYYLRWKSGYEHLLYLISSRQQTRKDLVSTALAVSAIIISVVALILRASGSHPI